MAEQLSRDLSIKHITPAGEELLAESLLLQEVVTRFLKFESPETRIGGRIIGEGRFSTVRVFDGAAVKVSSLTSSVDSNILERPIWAEDLIKQFRYQKVLGMYLKKQNANITVPEQYFAVKSRYGAYLLCQQYMEGWQPLGEWAEETFDLSSHTKDEQKRLEQPVADLVKERIARAVGNKVLRQGLNDLRLHKKNYHSGNLLVPKGSPFEDNMPLCIIDQPGIDEETKQKFSKLWKKPPSEVTPDDLPDL